MHIKLLMFQLEQLLKVVVSTTSWIMDTFNEKYIVLTLSIGYGGFIVVAVRIRMFFCTNSLYDA
ncbi:hypothetical protein VSU01S_30640 [Vibrio superstes NBRC 103154]|uniref:Uncharacterized protein n=1 Tax=Vibrio superstes NBRC 103154 TaxID=1219062 RepID=A0A511QTY1_9VIBR|nr:hypothetical protein VSU01S_30640 [Vibrio superstes NBRC 103154]